MRRPKVFFLAILSSTAAGLRVPFYLAATSACKEKVYLRLGTGYASGVYLGLLSVLSAAAVCSSSQTGAPRAGRLFLSVTNSPCCRAPDGLACSIFVRMPTPLCGPDLHFQISKRVGSIPIGLQYLDLLCTPHRCCANKKTATQSSGRLTPPTAHNLVNVCVIFEHLFIC